MKNVYLSGYFTGNLGDDLFVKVVSERYRNTHFKLLTNSKYQNYYGNFNNVSVIKYNLRKKIQSKFNRLINKSNYEMQIARNCDLILEIGGSIFQQLSVSQGITLRRQEYLKSGLPVFVVGSNFGPVLNQEFIFEYYSYFQSIKGTVFRDLNSYSLFRKIDNVSVAPDVVFLLDPTKVTALPKVKKRVVISVISVKDKVHSSDVLTLQREYEKTLIRMIEKFFHENFEIILFGFSKAENDYLAEKRIYDQLDTVIQEEISLMVHDDIDQSLELLKSADILISSRFHSMILGWIFSIPQYVVSYSNKTTNVINDSYPKQFSTTIRNLSDTDVSLLLDNVNTMPKGQLEKLQKEASGQFKYVDEYLSSN